MIKTLAHNCTGWRCDIPDQRDYEFSTRLYLKNLPIPVKVSLEKKCTAIEDQSWLGSCTAQAAVGAMEFLSKKYGHPKRNFSRLYVYWNTRAIFGATDRDSGATLRDTVKSVADHGVCKEKLWPYLPSEFKIKPKEACYKEGADHQVLSYYRLYTIDELKNCLAQGFPIIFGTPVYSSFMSQEVAKTGVVPYPAMSESLKGGHAMMIVGYNDTTQYFRVRNSWGTNWGQEGYCDFPYEYMANMSRDYWTIRSFERQKK